MSGSSRVYTTSLNGIGQVQSAVQNNKTLGFTYRNDGGLEMATPPFTGSSVSYDYDSRPMLTEENDPDRGTSKFEYNSLGELTRFETAKGDRDSIIYDFIGRDSIRVRQNGNTNYSYYTSGTGKGKLKQVSSPSGVKKYAYDVLGNITSESDSIPGQAFSFSYEYDDRGRMSGMTYPNGFAITYQYNTKGYLEYIRNASDNSIIWQCNTVNEFGNITQYHLSGGNIAVDKFYNGNGYLTDIKTTAGSITKQWFEYSFDANTGDLSWRKDRNRNLTEDFGYDVFDQLKWSKVTGQDSITLNYDDIGNITSKSDAGEYIYNPVRVHAVDSITGLQNINRQNIGYNFFNKPTFISTDADSLVYTYNTLDQKIKAVMYDSVGQAVKTTWYAGPYEKVIQGTVTKHYYYINSPDGLVALAIQEGSGTPVIYYICKDHLGSITGIMNSAGNMMEEYNYDPWGRRRNQTNWSYSNVQTPTYTQHGFTGHEHLDMFNLIHMNGRIYDSEIARFLSPDPIIQDPYNLLNYNRYSYCMNNPLKFIDPTGLKFALSEPEMQNLNPHWGEFSAYRSSYNDHLEKNLGSPGGGPKGALQIGRGDPTKDEGGFVDANEFYDYMLNHAKNTPVEVAAFELRKNGVTSFYVLPWKDNSPKFAVVHMDVSKYTSGYTQADIVSLYHTHLNSSRLSQEDRDWSDEYFLPIWAIGANGNSYMYISDFQGGTESQNLNLKTILSW